MGLNFITNMIRIHKCLALTILLIGIITPAHADNYVPLSVPPMLVKAQLVINLESGAVSPVVGVVSEDVVFNGETLIPAHSEIHGATQAQAFHDRIACNSQFTVVSPTERFLVTGIVLERGDPGSDGTYGLKGVPVHLYGGFVRVEAGHKFYLYVQAVSIIQDQPSPHISQ